MARKRRSARWWRKQTEEWEAVRGDVMAREFARQRGFNAGTFSWWRRELRRKDHETSKSLVPVQVIEQRSDVPVMRFPSGGLRPSCRTESSSGLSRAPASSTLPT